MLKKRIQYTTSFQTFLTNWQKINAWVWYMGIISYFAKHFYLLSTFIVHNIAEVKLDSTSICHIAWKNACKHFRDRHMMQFSYCKQYCVQWCHDDVRTSGRNLNTCLLCHYLSNFMCLGLNLSSMQEPYLWLINESIVWKKYL